MNIKYLLALIVWSASANVLAESVVIVNPDNANRFTEKEIRDIYLLKSRFYADGSQVRVYNLSGDVPAKNAFYKNVLGKTESRLTSQWVRMLFSSKGTPPEDVANADKMKKLVAANKDAIGFIDAADIDDSVKVVLRK